MDNGIDDPQPDPLEELEVAAREAMMRPRPLEFCWAPCSAELRLGAFVLDLLFGFACAVVGLLFLIVLDFDGEPSQAEIGSSMLILLGTCLPLLYSAMDWLPRNSPGKRLVGIRIEADPALQSAIVRRWLIKGLPFLLGTAVGLLGLAQALGEPGPMLSRENYFNRVGGYVLAGGYLWWLIASVVTFGDMRQTVPDLLAGTRLVSRRSLPERRGFEPVLMVAGPSTNEERPSPPPSPTGA